MFSQYGTNLTPDGNVFKALGVIVAAAQAEISLGAPISSVTSGPPASPAATLDSSARSPFEVVEVLEGNSQCREKTADVDEETSSKRERRSKLIHDRPSKVRIPVAVEAVVAESQEGERRAPSP